MTLLIDKSKKIEKDTNKQVYTLKRSNNKKNKPQINNHNLDEGVIDEIQLIINYYSNKITLKRK